MTKGCAGERMAVDQARRTKLTLRGSQPAHGVETAGVPVRPWASACQTRAWWCWSGSPGRASRRGPGGGSSRRRSCRADDLRAVVGHAPPRPAGDQGRHRGPRADRHQAPAPRPAHGHRLDRARPGGAAPATAALADGAGVAVPRRRRRHARAGDAGPQPLATRGRAVGGRHQPARGARRCRRGAGDGAASPACTASSDGDGHGRAALALRRAGRGAGANRRIP